MYQPLPPSSLLLVAGWLVVRDVNRKSLTTTGHIQNNNTNFLTDLLFCKNTAVAAAKAL